VSCKRGNISRASDLSKVGKRENRSFEDMVRRLLQPNLSLTASFERSRPIDGKARKQKKSFVPPKYSALAQAIAMKPDTFYNKLDGTSRFWAHEAKAILGQLHDIELANYFLEHTPFVPSHRIVEDDDEVGLLQRLVINALVHITDLTSMVDRTLHDGQLNHDERDSLYRKVLELETAVAAVRNQFEDGPHVEKSPPPVDY
jgi:hypothetical protein